MNMILYIYVWVHGGWWMLHGWQWTCYNPQHAPQVFRLWIWNSLFISLRTGIKDGLFLSLHLKFLTNVTQVIILFLWVEQLSLCDYLNGFYFLVTGDLYSFEFCWGISLSLIALTSKAGSLILLLFNHTLNCITLCKKVKTKLNYRPASPSLNTNESVLMLTVHQIIIHQKLGNNWTKKIKIVYYCK